VVLRKILVELHVTSTNSNNNLILLDANNGLRGSDEENITTGFGSYDWDSDIQRLYFV